MEAYVVHDHLGTVVSMAIIHPDIHLSVRRIPPAGCTVTRVTLKTSVDPEDGPAIEALVREHRIDIESKQLVAIKH